MSGRKTAKYENRMRFVRAMFSRKIVVVATVIVVLVILAALFADVLAPYNPNEQDLYHILQGPGNGHLFGTDAFGRDVLSRLIHGARVSLAVGLVAVIIACVIGTVLSLERKR